VPHWWCPSRRPQNVHPKGADPFYAVNAARATDGRIVAARTDYAACVGDRLVVETGTFPLSGGGTTLTTYNNATITNFDRLDQWPTDPWGLGKPNVNPREQYTGVCFQRSEVGIKHITDGTSNTYLIGEKYLNPTAYETGTDPGDNETWATGFNNDVNRCSNELPLQDNPSVTSQSRFGSPHAAGFYAAFCDGHVESVSFDVALTVHRANGNRADGGSPN
jgi:prepilin-type processing-associated H-X9-DG protein